MADDPGRVVVIDALRGFALLGILLVNIQSFTWGAGNPLGYFAVPPGPAEATLFFALATLVAGKFYAIFAFLFGVGFTLQTRKLLLLAGGSRARATRLYLRRIWFLFLVGLVHGIFLYFGDILATYALCALFVLPFAFARTRQLVRALAIAWALALSLLAFWTLLDLATSEPGSSSIAPELLAAHEVYATGTWLEQLQLRFGDDLTQLVGGVVLTWPQVVALMLTGALAGRLRWLQQPARHRLLWQRALRVGLLLGLPCAMAGGWLHLRTIETDPDAPFGADECLVALSVLLSCAYVALAVRGQHGALGALLLRALAPAGRMPLTMYVLQSVAMNVLLCAWGFGLSERLDRAGLTLLAVTIYGAELILGRLIAIRFRTGPLEWLWRRYTYRGLARAVPATTPSSSTRSQSPPALPPP